MLLFHVVTLCASKFSLDCMRLLSQSSFSVCVCVCGRGGGRFFVNNVLENKSDGASSAGLY